MDYKKTLNLPRTDFPMKAQLAQREPATLAAWQEMDLYGLMRRQGKGRPKFILHDGPPYANGRIHIGHVLNKTLKDIVVRYQFLKGHDTPYIPGWDCHGLPVEHALFKELHKTKEQVDRVAFRKMAHDYALKYVGVQREDFKRLGIVSDWERPYLTLDHGYEKAILDSFATLVEKGYIVRGLKPVNWCYKCETALAEAEVEYADHTSDSVFVMFALNADAAAAALGLKGKTFLLIWTTTPWTLLANVAVAVHPQLTYVCVEHEGASIILGKALFEAGLKEKLGWAQARPGRAFTGAQLEGLTYQHPFGLRQGKVVLADYVSKEEGSGCVHTAPGHGQEDFLTGKKYGLDVVMPVDARGCFDETVARWKGQHVFKANEGIIKELAAAGLLPAAEKVTHSYPHCWRCKNPIIFRATYQWFLKVDHEGLRQRLLEAIEKKVQWVPASGRGRIAGMVALRPDWCLSRQRYWGVPIPALVCKACGGHTLDSRVIRGLADRAGREGTDAWFQAPVTDFVPEGLRCACGGADFERSTDILDVWFDSGVSHQAVLKDKPDMKLPADLYLEGSDQHRGWFQASLIPSVAIDGEAPYRAVLTHGFVVGGDGRKMSKSLGNVIAPQDVIKEFGADILRLWVMASDYNEDVRLSKDILKNCADAYRKIRNTARFLLSNLYDFDPGRDRVPLKDLLPLDRWALVRLGEAVAAADEAYASYRFYVVFQKLFSFCNETLSSLYLDVLKDRLYTAGRASKERRSAQTVLDALVRALAVMLAPAAPFTAEEIYRFIPEGAAQKKASVQLEEWPEAFPQGGARQQDVASIDEVLRLRPEVLKQLEEKRAEGVIGSSLEAFMRLSLKDEAQYRRFEKHKDDLRFIFIVSGAQIVLEPAQSGPFVLEVTRAPGEKCARCWNYSDDVGADAERPGICGRCARAVQENG